MHSFGFRVEALDPQDKTVPIAVAGQTMVDVQRLLTDIGTMIVRSELRIQNAVPAELIKKFDLGINSSSDSGIGSGPKMGSESSLELALKILCDTFDFLGKGAVGTWMTDNFKTNESRTAVAKHLVELVDHLEGYKLIYGSEEEEPRELVTIERDKILEFADEEGPNDSAMVGVISRDKVKRNHWCISNDEYLVPIEFDKNIVPSDIPSFAAAGPIIVIGDIVKDEKGHIVSADRVCGCYSFPEVNFYTVISKDGDVPLFNPITAVPKYNRSNDSWTLENADLGISISKPSWDACAIAFHEYAKFLFDTYAGEDASFEGEEQEIREFLLSLLPA